ncbi:MAG: DUF6580 family putative transport protein [Bdellovibrio sp.]
MSKRVGFFIAVGFVLLGVLTRLMPHPANFTAVGALALWATTLFQDRRAAFAIPIIILILSDFILGFHSTLFWVYGAFMLITALSLWIQPRASWMRTVAGSLTASLLFFFITNFGVWMSGQMYPMNVRGLSECFVMALPFLKNQMAGDLVFSGAIGLAARALAERREQAVTARA